MTRQFGFVAAGAAVIVLAAPLGVPAALEEWVLFDAPRGSWLASVHAGAPVVVLEEREGWRRVRIEGWVAVPSGVAAAAPLPAPPSPVEQGSTAIVSGTIPPGPAGSVADGARSTLLVAGLEELDRHHQALGAECRPLIEAGARRVVELKEQAGRALNSSDNFRQAAEAKNQARAALREAEREQHERVTACRVRAEDLFQQHAVRHGFADSSGKFVFEGVAPGAYRVIILDPAGDLSRASALECRVESPGRLVLDPGTHRSTMEPFWGLR